MNENGYQSWLKKHPSALETFDEMIVRAKGKKIVVFLDYDGTLSNIVPNPDEAFMSKKMRRVVSEVARCFPTAIISGRSRDKVYGFVKLDDIYYAGSHGLDIAAPFQCQNRPVDKNGEEVVRFQPAQIYQPLIYKILDVLKEETNDIKGVMLENNKFCVSVHFRHVSDKDFPVLEEVVKSLVDDLGEFRLSEGKKVFEIRPDIEWDKGHALEYLLETLGYGSSNDVLPIYIGDDRTDEDAFKAIKKRGKGYSIVVSTSPKDTMASYSLRSPSDVKKFLSRLVTWKNNSDPS
ncbi:putative trehalose-phosphatase [Helianthus annuus]|uniref:Trehalose 6-phosphate phosphatase n=1 Tax=Helianthus annuus TaxID=4232 RepID=A0A251TFP9_HELAN|nr:trehalose-phosphate phosphatase B [Helianthus annuus]KAF5776114.1 putative trehalose-phosphatase [Helianthus annuus]KAJ0483949.1 putative trehalose-phosphatase [Helianthus annuus]KAJ0851683.1 putative trehalose-phosphatase [Helianthus annuus]